MRALILILFLASVVSAQTIVQASSVAVLNSNLATGGGTDDTVALQAVLDAGNVELIMDGVALISGLNVRSNTTIRGVSGGGFYLKSASNRAVIRNQNRSAGTITDTNIALLNLSINGNRSNQSKCADGGTGTNGNCLPVGVGYNVGLQFFGVGNLRLYDLYVYQSKNISVHLANVNHVRGSNIWMEQPDYVMDNHGGIQLQGNSANVSFTNIRCTRITDDCLAINAFDPTDVFGSLVSNGPITDVEASNIFLDKSFFGVRMVANDSSNYIDRAVVRNIHGTVQDLVFRLASGSEYGGPGAGDIRRVTFDGIDVSTFLEVAQPTYGEAGRIEGTVDQLAVLRFKQGRGWYADYRPMIRIKESVNSTVWCAGGCPSGAGNVKNLHAELDVYDPPGTDSTGGDSVNSGYRVQVDGSVGKLFVNIAHHRDASVTQRNGVVWVRAGTNKGVEELHLSGAVNRQHNTVAITGGHITRMFVNGFSDEANGGDFLAIVNGGAGVVGPQLRVSNMYLSAGSLVGGTSASAATLAGVISGVSVTFANLGTPNTPTQVYCSDCTAAATCSGGGSGAWAFRQAGAWKCQ